MKPPPSLNPSILNSSKLQITFSRKSSRKSLEEYCADAVYPSVRAVSTRYLYQISKNKNLEYKNENERKKKLWAAITRLSLEDLTKALQIIGLNNPSFQATAEVVDVDIVAQSESTLWRLKFFVKDALKAKGTSICLLN
ncbi:hypothetical protein L1049_011799 [Liquidambar formosana]|uniref:NET domain-containing protein n=1 Tax=Liquidambar formosana TaxID=63359 RepID=A0AAP0WYC3_LIQFO